MKTFAFMCLIAVALAAPAQKAAAAAGCTGAACQKAQTQLEAGIQKNLDIQAQELKGVEALQKMSKNAKTPAAGFEKEKKAVLDIQQMGIAVRANNQNLAKQINSPAIAGLATVADAQIKEETQVQGLNGTSADDATLTQLVKEVQDGTKQNQKNLEAAKSQKCAK